MHAHVIALGSKPVDVGLDEDEDTTAIAEDKASVSERSDCSVQSACARSS
jgi:hypothetical protein